MATQDQANNSEKFNKNMQGAEKASKGVKQTIAELTNEITRLNQDLKSMSNNFKEMAKNTKDVDLSELLASTGKSIDRIKELNKAANADFQQFETNSKKKGKFTAQMEKNRDTAQLEYNRLLSKEEILRERLDSVIAGSQDEKKINDSLEALQDRRLELTKNLKVYDELEERANQIEEATGFLDGMEEYVEHIPFVGKFLTSASEKSKQLRGNLAEGADESAIMAANFQAIAETGSKILLTGFVGFLTSGIGTASDRMTNLTRQFNMSRRESMRMNRDMVEFAENIPGLTASQLAESFISVSQNLGVVTNLSKESGRAFSNMTKNLGLSADEANNLLVASIGSGKNIEDFNVHLAGSVSIFNATNETAVRFQDVMKDIAGASAATQLTTAKFPGGLEKAAYQARRFGMTLSGMNSSAESLLSFEESIGAELEAELLTGKSLNLERARAAALTGNQTMLAEELKKNIGDINDFQNQSVLAQNAQAKALGMSRDELAEILMRQKAMAELSDVEGGSLEEKVRNELKRINNIKDQTKREEALAKLRDDTGADQLIQQEQNMSIQQRMLHATEKIADAAGLLIQPFEFLAGIFDHVSSAASGFFGFLGKIGNKMLLLGKFTSKALAEPVEKLNEMLAKSSTKFEKLKSLFAFGGKTAGKAGLMSFLKKIPILGLAVGTFMGIKRFRSGDILGGLGEIGSGIASLFPGVGTLVSAGIDTALLAGDLSGVTGNKTENQSKTVQSINQGLKTGGMMTAALGPMGGGIMFNKMLLKKLGDLIGVTKSSGDQIANAANKDIYIGPEKVGTSLSVSSIKNDG
tara:strand:+ start:5587 stop:8022 length:2436 start_codon:yes stop_codon:yes gene_type:complete